MSSNRPSVCRYCGKVNRSISGLHNHESSHRGIVPYHYCDKPFYSQANYMRHRFSKHDATKLHICECGCQQSFATNADLRRQLRRTTVQYTCKICGTALKDEASLKDYVDKHSDTKRHTCGCGRSFRYKSNLCRHQKSCERQKVCNCVSLCIIN